jgi:hypothetical protein
MIWGQQNEAIMTHIVTWTLMCATKEGEDEYGEILHNYSKEILFFLLFGEDFRKELDNYAVQNVEIWREWKWIDILAEITLIDKNEKETQYALFIELKAYSHTNERQLESYKKASEMHDYKGKKFVERFVLLGAWDEYVPEIDKECCKNNGFTAYTFQEILDKVFINGEKDFENSGNSIFDEFWIGYW